MAGANTLTSPSFSHCTRYRRRCTSTAIYTFRWRPAIYTLGLVHRLDGNAPHECWYSMRRPRRVACTVCRTTTAIMVITSHGRCWPSEGFELNGQMCLAVNVFDEGPHRQLQFWVMKPPGELGGKDDDDKLHWDLLYAIASTWVVSPSPSKSQGVPGLTTTRCCATGMETYGTSMTLEDTHCLRPTMVFCCLTRN